MELVSLFSTKPLILLSLMESVNHASLEVRVPFCAHGWSISDCLNMLFKQVGYQDSGADIAYVLQQKKKLDILTPSASPDPENANGWCFPDTEDGIITAVEKGATHLWANTILFASHPLQMSTKLTKYQDHLRVVGQPPNLVEKFDDKAYLNDLLRKQSSLTLPRAWTINMEQYQRSGLANIDLPFPLVAKPVRGRGSHGVKVCYNMDDLHQHLTSLFAESPTVLLEEFLSGEEATVTVMPPSEDRPAYWAMPVVVRFNHQEDIAPYNGITAVTENSRAISPEEAAHDPSFAEIQRQCETVARLLSVTAPIRIDVRRFKPEAKSDFALFDINMKPVS